MLRKIYIGFQEHGQGWERNNYKGGIPKDLQESLQGAGHYESSKEKDIERKKVKVWFKEMTFLSSQIQIKKADEAFAQFDASGDDELDYKVPSLLFNCLQLKI